MAATRLSDPKKFTVTCNETHEINSFSAQYGSETFGNASYRGKGNYGRIYKMTFVGEGSSKEVVVKSLYFHRTYNEDKKHLFAEDFHRRRQRAIHEAELEAYYNYGVDGIGAYFVSDSINETLKMIDKNHRRVEFSAAYNIFIIMKFEPGETMREYERKVTDIIPRLQFMQLHYQAVRDFPYVHCDGHADNFIVQETKEGLRIKVIDRGRCYEEGKPLSEYWAPYRWNATNTDEGLPPEFLGPRDLCKPQKASDYWFMGQVFQDFNDLVDIKFGLIAQHMQDPEPSKRPGPEFLDKAFQVAFKAYSSEPDAIYYWLYFRIVYCEEEYFYLASEQKAPANPEDCVRLLEGEVADRSLIKEVLIVELLELLLILNMNKDHEKWLYVFSLYRELEAAPESGIIVNFANSWCKRISEIRNFKTTGNKFAQQFFENITDSVGLITALQCTSDPNKLAEHLHKLDPIFLARIMKTKVDFLRIQENRVFKELGKVDDFFKLCLESRCAQLSAEIERSDSLAEYTPKIHAWFNAMYLIKSVRYFADLYLQRLFSQLDNQDYDLDLSELPDFLNKKHFIEEFRKFSPVNQVKFYRCYLQLLIDYKCHVTSSLLFSLRSVYSLVEHKEIFLKQCSPEELQAFARDAGFEHDNQPAELFDLVNSLDKVFPEVKQIEEKTILTRKLGDLVLIKMIYFEILKYGLETALLHAKAVCLQGQTDFHLRILNLFLEVYIACRQYKNPEAPPGQRSPRGKFDYRIGFYDKDLKIETARALLAGNKLTEDQRKASVDGDLGKINFHLQVCLREREQLKAGAVANAVS